MPVNISSPPSAPTLGGIDNSTVDATEYSDSGGGYYPTWHTWAGVPVDTLTFPFAARILSITIVCEVKRSVTDNAEIACDVVGVDREGSSHTITPSIGYQSRGTTYASDSVSTDIPLTAATTDLITDANNQLTITWKWRANDTARTIYMQNRVYYITYIPIGVNTNGVLS